MKIIQKKSSLFIFLIITVLYYIGNFIWWYLNTPIFPNGDSAVYFNDIFKMGYLYYNAPLITWIMKGIFFIFGKQYFDLQIILMNYIFFLIALYFIYKIGVKLKDKETGNIAMILFALTPAIYELGRQYGHHEYHVMIAVVINMYCLMKTDNFKNTKWSILYGISVGFGMLVKGEFLAYFFCPWLYIVICSLIEKAEKKNIINISLTIIIGCLISACQYFRIEIINKQISDPLSDVVPIFCFESLKITTTGLSEYLLSPPIFILFIVGLIWFIRRYNNKYKKWIMLLWLIVPWIIITLMPHYKLPEYCLGFVPAIILIISVFITNVRNIKKFLLLFFVIIIYLLQYIWGVYHNDDLVFKGFHYYSNRISYNSYIRNKEELNFCSILFNRLNKYSVNKCFFWDTTIIGYLDLCTLEVLCNIYSKYNIILAFLNFQTGFDVVITDEDGLLDRTSERYVLKENDIYYANDLLETEKQKKEYMEQRIKIIEEVKNYIENNFVLVEKFPYRGHTIKIYKLNNSK